MDQYPSVRSGRHDGRTFRVVAGTGLPGSPGDIHIIRALSEEQAIAWLEAAGHGPATVVLTRADNPQIQHAIRIKAPPERWWLLRLVGGDRRCLARSAFDAREIVRRHQLRFRGTSTDVTPLGTLAERPVAP